MNAKVDSDVKFAPGFDKDGARCVVGEENFQSRAFVLKIAYRRRCFDCPIIESGRFHQTGRGQLAPARRDNSQTHARIESGGGVLTRVSAQRDADRFAYAKADSDPEVIDVRRDPINFRGECDRSSGNMNEIAVVEIQVIAWPALFSASVWQALKEKKW
jgi:hypothetical protein